MPGPGAPTQMCQPLGEGKLSFELGLCPFDLGPGVTQRGASPVFPASVTFLGPP